VRLSKKHAKKSILFTIGMMFATYLDDMAGMVNVIIRFGKGPNAESLYAGHCEATPEGVSALLGVSPLVARRALRRAGRFVPVSSTEHDEPVPMFVAVITSKTGKGYDVVCA
jgi:hypothetical protein